MLTSAFEYIKSRLSNPKQCNNSTEEEAKSTNQSFTSTVDVLRMCKKLKTFMRKLQTCCLFTGFSKRVGNCGEFEEEGNAALMIPSDVKEGHVAVIAVKGERTKRFVLELEELNKPEFMRLLEQAREEFGFQPRGPLTIPCQPEEVQKILQGCRES